MTFGVPHIGTRLRGRAVFSLFHPKKKLNLLEIGCGSSYFSYELQKRGHDVTSLDSLTGITKKDLTDLKTIFGKGGKTFNFVDGRATRLPFPDRSFDAVFIIDVIEHVPDQNKVMKEIFRVLKPDGFFIASTPAKGFHRGMFKRFFRFLHQHTFLRRIPIWYTTQLYPETHMKSEGHLREYSLEEWESLCSKHGFILEDWKREYVFFGAFFIELYHTFTFVDRYGNYIFPFLYPLTFIDYLLPFRGTGIALRARKL
jgi:ubiquinone/menaquinone biosynthesis C-methylase UbiE